MNFFTGTREVGWKTNKKRHLFLEEKLFFNRKEKNMDEFGSPSKKTGTCCQKFSWPVFWQVVSLVAIGLTLVIVLLSTIFVAKQDQTFRICPIARDSFVVGGPGETGAVIRTKLDFNTNSDSVPFQFHLPSGLSSVTAIHVKGPINAGTQVGSLAFAVCGAPAENPCATILDTITGESIKVFDNVHVGTPITSVIANVRKDPQLYYIEVLTNTRPVSPGAARADITGTCGFE